MNRQSNIPKTMGWRIFIKHALATVTLDDLQLYAGDDRRRMARHRVVHQGCVRQAAVLIPIVAAKQPYIVLTERSHSLRSHPGQISFPGGRVESNDVDVQAAALRESHEEVGLDPACVDLLGRLPDYVTGTGFNIAPCVGWVAADARFTSDSGEVARVFSVPLEYMMSAEHFRLETMTIENLDYRFHVIEYEDNYIWGATAAMLFGLRECIAQADLPDKQPFISAH